MSEPDLVAALLAAGWRDMQYRILVTDDGFTTHQLRRILVAPITEATR